MTNQPADQRRDTRRQPAQADRLRAGDGTHDLRHFERSLALRGFAPRDEEPRHLVGGVEPVRSLGDVPDDRARRAAELVLHVRKAAREPRGGGLDAPKQIDRHAIRVEPLVRRSVFKVDHVFDSKEEERPFALAHK